MPFIHTHTRLMALCPGLPRWAGTRKVKPIWILLKQETVSGSGISWANASLHLARQTDNHASTSPLSFLQAGCPSCRPTNSVKALKAHAMPFMHNIQKDANHAIWHIQLEKTKIIAHSTAIVPYLYHLSCICSTDHSTEWQQTFLLGRLKCVTWWH